MSPYLLLLVKHCPNIFIRLLPKNIFYRAGLFYSLVHIHLFTIEFIVIYRSPVTTQLIMATIDSIDFTKLAKDMEEASKKRINIKALQELEKKLLSSIDNSAKKYEESMQKNVNEIGVSPSKKQCLRKVTGKKQKQREPAHTNGATVNRGLDEGKIELTEQECQYLERRLKRIKKVTDLTEDQLRYLITVKFFDHLRGVKEGTVKSEIHTQFLRYKRRGKPMQELYSDVKTTLFTRAQVDYIQGCLQGKFYCKKEQDGDYIKLNDIDYISTVLFKEATTQIVMLALKKDFEEAQEYMTSHAIANADSSLESDLD